jgi:hypothetical protein
MQRAEELHERSLLDTGDVAGDVEPARCAADRDGDSGQSARVVGDQGNSIELSPRRGHPMRYCAEMITIEPTGIARSW